MTDAQSAQTALDKLIEAVEAGEPSEFRKANRAAFSTPCQDMALQLREEHCRHAFKGSLDAALALHEALLPGWWFQTSAVDGWATCHVARSGAGVPEEAPSGAETPARAWLLAILRAYRSTQP